MRIFSRSAWAGAETPLKTSSAQPIAPITVPIAERVIVSSLRALERGNLPVQIEHRADRLRARAPQFRDRRIGMARRTGCILHGRPAEPAERADTKALHDLLRHVDPPLRAFDPVGDVDETEIEMRSGGTGEILEDGVVVLAMRRNDRKVDIVDPARHALEDRVCRIDENAIVLPAGRIVMPDRADVEAELYTRWHPIGEPCHGFGHLRKAPVEHAMERLVPGLGPAEKFLMLGLHPDIELDG